MHHPMYLPEEDTWVINQLIVAHVLPDLVTQVQNSSDN